MRTVDIAEVIAETIEKKILGEWKHEGYAGGVYTDRVRCTIDDKEYVIEVKEVE